MIFWTGKGIFAILIPIAFFIVFLLLAEGVEVLFQIEDLNATKWVIFLTLLTSAISCWFGGKKVNGGKPKLLIDPETNEQVLLKKSHTFWFINLEYWSIPYGLLAFIVFFTKA
tara:strand:- start:6 stop:344 length:339 start_codon:yes stop_codon:yes gene_type:complete